MRPAAPRSASILEPRNWALISLKRGATKHMMELIAHSLCITNSALAKVARKGWPGKTALLNGQSMGPKSELHHSPELTNAHWQLIVGLKAQLTRLRQTNGDVCWASAMLPRKMSRCKLPSGTSDNRRMKPSTIDHQLSSQGLYANSLKMIWGVTLLQT